MKVSIVTPSFNQGQFLERTIQSVLQQDVEGLEYIVIDGGSCDNSHTVLEEYRTQLTHLIIEPDEGQADALRKGFLLTTGEVLAFLNSDDVLLPGALEFVQRFFADHPEIDAVYSHRVFIDAQDRVIGFWILPMHSSYFMSRWDFIPQETCFWRRSLMERAGPVDASYHFALDYELFVRMMKTGRFARANRFLSAFRRHELSKSTTRYETVGRQEVLRVRAQHQVCIRWYDQVLGYLVGGSIHAVSFLFGLFATDVVRARIGTFRNR